MRKIIQVFNVIEDGCSCEYALCDDGVFLKYDWKTREWEISDFFNSLIPQD